MEFLGGRTHGALVTQVDRQGDLAALEIANPREPPVAVSFEPSAAARLTACGFGPNGEYRCIAGPVVGAAEGPGQTSLEIAGAVRSGDSGGGVFDEQGRLVAVIWGESGGVTYASTGAPLARFVEGVLGGRAVPYTQACEIAGTCPNGQCPLVSRPATAPIFSAAPRYATPAQAAPAVAPGGPTARATRRNCTANRRTGTEEAGSRRLFVAERTHWLCTGGSAHRVREPEPAAAQVASKSTRRPGAGRRGGRARRGRSGDHGAGRQRADWMGPCRRHVGRRLARGAVVAQARSRRPRSPPGKVSRLNRSRNRPRRRPPPRTAPFARQNSRSNANSPSSATTVKLENFYDFRNWKDVTRYRTRLQDGLHSTGSTRLPTSDADAPRAAWADELRRELRERFNEVAPTKFQASL